jgi:S1-C subfamily serine protease
VQVEGEGERHSAHAILFDPRNDIAVLRVEGIEEVPPLRLDPNAPAGRSGAIIGYPHNGPLTIEPGRLGPTITALSQDAYGRGPVKRRITTLAGEVRSGNSGGPMVDGRGRVLTMIFASAVSGSRRAGYGVPDTVIRDALAKARSSVDTGPCTRG